MKVLGAISSVPVFRPHHSHVLSYTSRARTLRRCLLHAQLVGQSRTTPRHTHVEYQALISDELASSADSIRAGRERAAKPRPDGWGWVCRATGRRGCLPTAGRRRRKQAAADLDHVDKLARTHAGLAGAAGGVDRCASIWPAAAAPRTLDAPLPHLFTGSEPGQLRIVVIPRGQTAGTEDCS